MQQLNFSDIRGGKLFCDQFDDVRLCDRDKFIVGNCFEITVKNQPMGVARILTVFSFPFFKLSDAVAMRTYGKGAHYMAAILKKYYNDPAHPIQPSTIMQQVVFQYTERNLDTQRLLLQDFWNKKEEQQPHYSGQTKLNF